MFLREKHCWPWSCHITYFKSTSDSGTAIWSALLSFKIRKMTFTSFVWVSVTLHPCNPKRNCWGSAEANSSRWSFTTGPTGCLLCTQQSDQLCEKRALTVPRSLNRASWKRQTRGLHIWSLSSDFQRFPSSTFLMEAERGQFPPSYNSGEQAGKQDVVGQRQATQSRFINIAASP